MMNKETRLKNLTEEIFGDPTLSLDYVGINDMLEKRSKYRINIVALGDVGTNILMGLRLLGSDVISEIGIFDLNSNQLARLEMEFNQMSYPPGISYDGSDISLAHSEKMPPVKIITKEEIPKCDVIIFAATKGIPEVGVKGDVRMMQLEANLSLVSDIGSTIKTYNEGGSEAEKFNGLVAVVSDPVDQLCRGMLEYSGLNPGQIRGFGLGVMAARAKYFAERNPGLESFLIDGRAFGPHGEGLVIANSIRDYDDEISKELTKLARTANLKVRDLGYKPFLAPAISSAAISILLTLRGEWNYGSVYFGCDKKRGAYLGVLSRLCPAGVEYEDLSLPKELYQRIKKAYLNLIGEA